MDVTADGSYVLATTPYYLLVIPTQIDGQAKSGFGQSITAKAAPPIKLQISPDDMVKYNIAQLDFTPAHFNTGDAQEEFISTSTGNYIITWNFTKIKQGTHAAAQCSGGHASGSAVAQEGGWSVSCGCNL